MQNVNDIPGKWRQLMAGMIVNLASFVGGLSTAWTSTVIQDLQKANNSMGIEVIGDYDASWLISVVPIGMLAIVFVGPNLCELFGRKNTALIQALLIITCWLLRLFSTNINVLLIAQIVGGASDGLAALVTPLYISEIAGDLIRGRLGSLCMFAIKGGYLVGFVLVALLPYRVFAGCTLVAPVLLIGGLLLLPETPIYLIRNDRIDEAKKSLMWFRGNDKMTAEYELRRLQEFNKKIAQSKLSLGIKDLFIDRVNFRGLIIGLMMILVQQISGIGVMLFYIVTILQKAETSLNQRMTTIIYASIHLCGCWISTLTVDRFGRRPLMFLSTLGMAAGHSILGLYFLLQNSAINITGFHWLPIIGISVYGAAYSAGAGPLASVIANEVFNPQLASICNSIYLIVFGVLSFSITKLFPVITHAISLHNLFFILVVTCIAGFFIVFVIVPETKGKSIESIRDELQGVKKKIDKDAEELSMDIVTIARIAQ